LKRLRLSVFLKRTQKRAAGAKALHHDNAPAHTTHSIQVFLASHSIPVVLQTPYSPDMAPCGFWLFPLSKTLLKGKRFEDTDAIKKNVASTLNTISKTLSKYVFKSGKTAGRSVSAHKKGILKIIKYL
jgi:transaldolase